MNERILLRSAPLGNWNVPSAAILLPAGERDPETLLRQAATHILSERRIKL